MPGLRHITDTRQGFIIFQIVFGLLITGRNWLAGKCLEIKDTGVAPDYRITLLDF